MNKPLNNRVIMVTGAGSGIGREIALGYAHQGATVLLLGKTADKLTSLYDEMMEQGVPEPGIIPLDLATASAADMQELGDIILNNYGCLHGLLHNAAILGDRVPVEHYDLNTWLKVMHVNFTATCLLTRILMPLLRLSDNARLVFTTSSVGSAPRAYWGAYSVSKYALEGYAQLLFEELDNTSNISVCLVNPGATRTNMRAAAYPNEDPGTVPEPASLLPIYQHVMNPASDVHGNTYDKTWLK